MQIAPEAVKPACSPPRASVESSPSGYKEEKHLQTLSSSLKERLKRSRRSFTSPTFSVAKRLCVDDDDDDDEGDEGQRVPADSQDAVNDPPQIIPDVEARSGSDRFPGPVPEPTRAPWRRDFARRGRLRTEVKDKTETLRRLKMVQMYRSKNDLTQLQTLIDKWRSCAQAALYELQSDVPMDGRKASLSELIDLFGLDDGILRFERAEEDFAT